LRSNACSTLLDILENDVHAAYSRHLLQKEMISVANEVQSNNDRLHVDAIAYYYATINPRKQDNMAGDRHLQSSTGVRDENYDNTHRIHISERVTRVSISVYLDIVQTIRQHAVQVHPLAFYTGIPGGCFELYTFIQCARARYPGRFHSVAR
jgi:hypothetical protein